MRTTIAKAEPPRTALAYEEVPQVVMAEPSGDVVRITIPVIPADRRALCRGTAARMLGMFWSLPAFNSLAFAPVRLWRTHGIHLWRCLLTVPVLIAFGVAVLGLLGVAFGWVMARLLRPTVLQVDAQSLTATSLGRRRSRVWDRHRVRRVEVRRWPGAAHVGELQVLIGYDPATITAGRVADLDVAAGELRAALGSPAVAHKPVGGGESPRAAAASCK